jgi:hypothetical protein
MALAISSNKRHTHTHIHMSSHGVTTSDWSASCQSSQHRRLPSPLILDPPPPPADIPHLRFTMLRDRKEFISKLLSTSHQIVPCLTRVDLDWSCLLRSPITGKAGFW